MSSNTNTRPGLNGLGSWRLMEVAPNPTATKVQTDQISPVSTAAKPKTAESKPLPAVVLDLTVPSKPTHLVSKPKATVKEPTVPMPTARPRVFTVMPVVPRSFERAKPAVKSLPRVFTVMPVVPRSFKRTQPAPAVQSPPLSEAQPQSSETARGTEETKIEATATSATTPAPKKLSAEAAPFIPSRAFYTPVTFTTSSTTVERFLPEEISPWLPEELVRQRLDHLDRTLYSIDLLILELEIGVLGPVFRGYPAAFLDDRN
ncbi:uncharacterized protein RSE6_12950 [Rhynchosporium secalis]|uniref:Uncharacterized protein n=1 Tax=Rhynchosporium secalis TaxID=38038 RepID=A0A1E1MRN8_RHYSE|nr:uncharacterized protein RSE6_12950 [Rhynchosporium secalis]